MYKDFEQLPLVLSVPEVARVLNLGRDTTYGLVRSGRIRSVRVGRQYRVPKAAVMEYLSA
jgi:excisionase family DNA binding protein